jgi:hypothetical protein
VGAPHEKIMRRGNSIIAVNVNIEYSKQDRVCFVGRPTVIRSHRMHTAGSLLLVGAVPSCILG